MTHRLRAAVTLSALALSAPVALTLASAPAHADVAPCGRCSSVGARPSASAMVGASLVVAGVAGALVIGRRRR